MGLLEMSISAGVLILLLTLLRRERFWYLSRRTMMLLWMVALARLLLPDSLPVRKGIAVPVFAWMRQVCGLQADILWQAEEKMVVRTMPMPKAASFGTAQDMGIGLQEAAAIVWLAGVVICGIYFLYCYRREYRLLAEALPLESMPSSEQLQVREAYETAVRLSGMRMRTESVRLLVHDRVRTPLVFGTIRQSIIIPKSLLCQKQQLQYILTHEIVHIRRFDNLWKRLSVAAVCIHWFNPAVWLMYRLFARDLELSCDEQALSAYGSRGRQQYAMTLLMLAQNQKGSALFCSGFLENPVKERIESIMKYKKITGIGVICAVLLVTGASSVFATNEQTNPEQNEKATLQSTDAAAQDTDEINPVEYEIMKSADGEEPVETSGGANIHNTENKKGEEDIILRVCESEQLHEEDIWVSFHSDSEITVSETDEIKSSTLSEQTTGKLEPGKTYKYHMTEKTYEEINPNSVSNAKDSEPELVETRHSK